MEKPHPITSLRTSNVFSPVRQGATHPGLSNMWVWAGQRSGWNGTGKARGQSHGYLHYRKHDAKAGEQEQTWTVPPPLLQQRETLHLFQEREKSNRYTPYPPSPKLRIPWERKGQKETLQEARTRDEVKGGRFQALTPPRPSQPCNYNQQLNSIWLSKHSWVSKEAASQLVLQPTWPSHWVRILRQCQALRTTHHHLQQTSTGAPVRDTPFFTLPHPSLSPQIGELPEYQCHLGAKARLKVSRHPVLSLHGSKLATNV